VVFSCRTRPHPNPDSDTPRRGPLPTWADQQGDFFLFRQHPHAPTRTYPLPRGGGGGGGGVGAPARHPRHGSTFMGRVSRPARGTVQRPVFSGGGRARHNDRSKCLPGCSHPRCSAPSGSAMPIGKVWSEYSNSGTANPRAFPREFPYSTAAQHLTPLANIAYSTARGMKANARAVDARTLGFCPRAATLVRLVPGIPDLSAARWFVPSLRVGDNGLSFVGD